MSDLQKEFDFYKNEKLTEFDETTGHYILSPQRSCFVRCEHCDNLSEADCYNDENGDWVWCNECLFCIQRAIDMLGFYEHKKPPILSIHDTPKKRRRENPHDLYAALEKAAEAIRADNERQQ